MQGAPAPGYGGRLASWGSRAAAFVIDGAIVSIPAGIVVGLLVAGIVASGDSEAGVIAFVIGILLAVLVVGIAYLLYAPLLMMRSGERNGQTLGKQLMNIRVVRVDGKPIDFGSAALREVVMKTLAVLFASSIVPIVPFLLNYLWPLWDNRNETLHDKMCSTKVVKA